MSLKKKSKINKQQEGLNGRHPLRYKTTLIKENYSCSSSDMIYIKENKDDTK